MIDLPEMYIAGVLFGDNNELTLDMCVIKEEYDVTDEHIVRWDEVEVKEEGTFKTENYIRIVSCADPKIDRQVCVFHNGWTITGKWDTMEHVQPHIFVYHCHNAIFRFDVLFNIERDSWDGDYESLLHD